MPVLYKILCWPITSQGFVFGCPIISATHLKIMWNVGRVPRPLSSLSNVKSSYMQDLCRKVKEQNTIFGKENYNFDIFKDFFCQIYSFYTHEFCETPKQYELTFLAMLLLRKPLLKSIVSWAVDCVQQDKNFHAELLCSLILCWPLYSSISSVDSINYMKMKKDTLQIFLLK